MNNSLHLPVHVRWSAGAWLQQWVGLHNVASVGTTVCLEGPSQVSYVSDKALQEKYPAKLGAQGARASFSSPAGHPAALWCPHIQLFSSIHLRLVPSSQFLACISFSERVWLLPSLCIHPKAASSLSMSSMSKSMISRRLPLLGESRLWISSLQHSSSVLPSFFPSSLASQLTLLSSSAPAAISILLRPEGMPRSNLMASSHSSKATRSESTGSSSPTVVTLTKKISSSAASRSIHYSSGGLQPPVSWITFMFPELMPSLHGAGSIMWWSHLMWRSLHSGIWQTSLVLSTLCSRQKGQRLLSPMILFLSSGVLSLKALHIQGGLMPVHPTIN